MNKKILICGATGFMGRNIVEHFNSLQGYEVYGVGLKRDLENCNFKTVNLTSKQEVNELFSEHRFNIVIQAAANTSGSKDIIERPYLHVTDNAVMNSWILQACYDRDWETTH